MAIRLSVAIAVCTLAAQPALASFHSLQIEQVIAGVNGHTSAQAIQLRMRGPGENLVSFARIRAWDSAGKNPIILIDFDANVPSGAFGDRVLITSPDFANHTDVTLASDFTMTNLIPESYLKAGRITYEFDDGTIYWSLSFGGAAYTGPTTGNAWNDTDGDFGPPFDGPLPSSGRQALQFPGLASDPSVTNQTDYALTNGPAIFTNNAGESATLVPKMGDLNGDDVVDLDDHIELTMCLAGPGGGLATGCHNADMDGDGDSDLRDFAVSQRVFEQL